VTILCIPYSHALSHISRPLLVVRELRKRGHEIVFAGESPKVSFIEKEGFHVIPLHEPNPDVLLGNIRKRRLRFVNGAEVEKMVDADLALFKEVNPDMVLTDGRFSAPLSTGIARIRHVAIVNASSTPYRAVPYVPFFEWMPSSIFGRRRLRAILDTVNLRLEMAIFDNMLNIFKKMTKKYKLEKIVTATACLTGKDMTLLPDIPEYFPSRDLPENYHYIGPLTWHGNIPLPSWWPPENIHRPLVYITMGTTGLSDFFRKVYDLVRASGISAIITSGGQAVGLETIGGIIYVEDFINGDAVMEACDVVVCHGGNGTIYQALRHGRPIIGIPTLADQQYNMRRVQALGVGKTLRWKEFSRNPSTLMEYINQMYTDTSYTLNAARLSDIISTYDAAKTATDLIERNTLI
jgi:UDP:flavonoid glycosyltransferase YjiC (YdhE family)